MAQFKDTIDANAVLDLRPDSAIMAAGEMSFAADAQTGNYIVGPVSFTSPFTQMRFSAGLLKLNTLLLSTMPSTIITPIPVFEFDMPAKSASGLRSVLSLVMSTAVGG